jgi:2-polyprenyl-3-methyl-5-hydroxy-6-metoxy-1,4-benzoquinol methylase
MGARFGRKRQWKNYFPEQNTMTPFHETLKTVQTLYADERGISGWIQRQRPKICPFHELLPLVPAGARVLDVGCGSGLWAGLLAVTHRAASVYGFDTSQKAIDVARRMQSRLPKEQQEKLVFECRSVADGLPEEQFDAITMIDVLHHIPPKFQEQAVLDVWTRVKPGGVFLYKDMASKPFWCGLMNRLHDLASARSGFITVPSAEWKTLLNWGAS